MKKGLNGMSQRLHITVWLRTSVAPASVPCMMDEAEAKRLVADFISADGTPVQSGIYPAYIIGAQGKETATLLALRFADVLAIS